LRLYKDRATIDPDFKLSIFGLYLGYLVIFENGGRFYEASGNLQWSKNGKQRNIIERIVDGRGGIRGRD
jgi:hypothetical protein